MTHWLSIDTAMNACGVGLRRADGKLFEKIEVMDRGQSERLMPLILEIVSEAGLTLQDIGAYAVTVGPGTFTGLRVGLATVRALSQVSGKPAVAVGTFEALAAGYDPSNTCILIETKRTDYYVRHMGEEGEGACLEPTALKDFLKPDWLLVGDAVARAATETGCQNKSIHLASPSAANIISIAEKHLAAGAVGVPEPRYLRPADTSISKQKPARIV